jgi:hypothetical protein
MEFKLNTSVAVLVVKEEVCSFADAVQVDVCGLQVSEFILGPSENPRCRRLGRRR